MDRAGGLLLSVIGGDEEQKMGRSEDRKKLVVGGLLSVCRRIQGVK